MKNKLSILTVAVFFSFALMNFASAQETIVSPINGFSLSPSTTAEFRFLVGGHLYGSHNESIYPASSLLAHTEKMREQEAEFFVSLGDMVKYPTEKYEKAFVESFADPLGLPIFSAIGNHDATTELFTDQKPYYAFEYGNASFIFLDTISGSGNISGDQLNFLKSEIVQANQNPDIDHLFLFTHYLIWAPEKTELRPAYEYSNSTKRYKETNFWSDIAPLLGEKNTTVFSGDVGTQWSYPLVVAEHKGITFVATGIGDTQNDLLVQVQINGESKKLLLVPLNNENAKDISHYSIEAVQKQFSNPSLKERLKALHSPSVLLGILISFCTAFIIHLIVRKSYEKK